MRTAITMDEDVARALERVRERQKRSFKSVVNDALRAGLLELEREEPVKAERYETEAVAGLPRVQSLDNVHELLDHIDGPARR